MFDGKGLGEVRERKTPLKKKRPNTTIMRILLVLPHWCHCLLFSKSKDFFASKFLVGAGFGGFMGIGIYYLLVHPMSLYEDQKVKLLYGLAASFAIGWGTSTLFRCATLIIATSVLGKEGRACLVVLALSSIYAGPVANLEHNMEEVVRSIGCTVELQINQSKLAWKVMTAPIKKIAEDLVKTAKNLKDNSGQVMNVFKDTVSEVDSTEGYDRANEKAMEEAKNEITHPIQRTLSIKTILRCQYIIERGVDKCYDWFDKKHEDCMKTIWLPILNSLLCLPMKMKFFCKIIHLANYWCKKRLPLQGNFGELFDKVNGTLDSMDNGFSANMVARREEQSMLVGMNVSQLLITDEVMENMSKKKGAMEKIMSFFKVLLSCTFIFLFISAFNYCSKYNSDILFDNLYVSTYFKQIDARRKKMKKRHLLPLLKDERKTFIFPVNPAIQGPELKISATEILQSTPVLLLFILSIAMDLTLNHILQIIRRHAPVSYTFSSSHRLEIFVGGDTLLANFLRQTIAAFNTSSSTFEVGNYNEACLPSPIHMTALDYLFTCLPLAALLSLCLIQVYVHRLHRVIAAFYYPKKEKKRILFLYNKTLRQRKATLTVRRNAILRRARINRLKVRTLLSALYRHWPWIRRLIPRRCIVCHSLETERSYVCRTPDCGTVYCSQCWREMRRFCFACTPYDEFITDAASHTDHEGSDGW